MKVRFIGPGGKPHPPTSGKGRFMQRLSTVFTAHGIEPVYNLADKTDIDFYISKFHYGTHNCKKRVLRLGPVQIDKGKDYKHLNRKKRNALKNVDGVIYQSAFAKKMCDSIIGGTTRPHTIIFNGAIPWNGPAIQSPYAVNFMASARKWTSQKRLMDTLTAFLSAAIPDSGLFVVGDTGDQKVIRHKNIKYFGPVNDKILFSLHKLCNAMVHIVWLDVCPNGVVEALVNGCPVISNDQGGTCELGVQTIVPEPPWCFRPIHLGKPPHIDTNLLAGAMIKHSTGRVPVAANHLHIDTIAKQYADFFKRILNEG